MAATKFTDIQILQGKESIHKYQFNSNTAEHYFCKNCGIYTHHRRRSNPDEYAYNVANLKGVDPLLIEGIMLFDGRNHPNDQ